MSLLLSLSPMCLELGAFTGKTGSKALWYPSVKTVLLCKCMISEIPLTKVALAKAELLMLPNQTWSVAVLRYCELKMTTKRNKVLLYHSNSMVPSRPLEVKFPTAKEVRLPTRAMLQWVMSLPWVLRLLLQVQAGILQDLQWYFSGTVFWTNSW